MGERGFQFVLLGLLLQKTWLDTWEQHKDEKSYMWTLCHWLGGWTCIQIKHSWLTLRIYIVWPETCLPHLVALVVMSKDVTINEAVFWTYLLCEIITWPWNLFSLNVILIGDNPMVFEEIVRWRLCESSCWVKHVRQINCILYLIVRNFEQLISENLCKA